MTKRIMMAAVAAALAVACGSAGVGQSPTPSESPSPFPGHVDGVTVFPAAVGVGQQVQLAAAVAAVGTIDRSVSWALAAGSQGSVDALTGLYSAPATAGTFAVVATSVADATKKGSGAVTVTAVTPPPAGVVPAFLGAQGGGSRVTGGRGGAVMEVTNLDDSGPGSLRACVEGRGARTCVFRVSGTIVLTSGGYKITSPNLTVAGQTAPGGGIQIVGPQTQAGACQASIAIRNGGGNVIWRYTRIRHGKNPYDYPPYNQGPPYCGSSGFATPASLGAAGIMFDHNSIEWADNKAIEVWNYSTNPMKDMTFSYNIAGETLAPHDSQTLTGAGASAYAEPMTDIDFHHNLWSSNQNRFPLLKHKSGRYVNNIAYNWQYYAGMWGGGITADIVGNVWKRGPRSPAPSNVDSYEIRVFPGGSSETTTSTPPSLRISGNVGPHGDASTDNWTTMVRLTNGETHGDLGPLSQSYRRDTPMAATGLVPIVEEPAAGLEASLLPVVGASRRLDCDGSWVPNRDALDARVVADYQSGTAPLAAPADEVAAGGFPTLAAGTPCADADHDGMPDAWELSHGLDPADPADGPRLQADGRSNLEHYLDGR